MIQSTNESKLYRSFVQPQKSPSTFYNESFQQSSMSGHHNLAQPTDISKMVEHDYSNGYKDYDENSTITLSSKLSQLQRWINNINEDITSERRDLLLVKGKLKTMEIQVNFEVDQSRKNVKSDEIKVQNEMDRLFKIMRKDTFELGQVVELEQKSDKQLKKDINKCQRRVAAADIEVGKGNVKRTKQKQLQMQQQKQDQMGQTSQKHPENDYSYYTYQNTTYSSQHSHHH